MSAAIASRRRPSRMASAMYGSSSTSSTRMLRCYELAHIADISKTAYGPATPRCLEWRHDLQQTGADKGRPASQDPCLRPAGRHSGDRRGPWLPVAGVVVLEARATH